MTNKRRLMYCALGMVLLLACIGIYSKCQRKPVVESVERDTVIVYDTVPHYYPKPVEVEKVRTEYKFLTRVQTSTDTLLQHDSVLVEVPITSKHYGCKDYDAWVSGYEPSLDSIKVYQKTEYITETITRMKPPNEWELNLVGGIGYNFNGKNYTPHIGGEMLYMPNRLKVGVIGGIEYRDKVEPVIGGVIKIRIL